MYSWCTTSGNSSTSSLSLVSSTRLVSLNLSAACDGRVSSAAARSHAVTVGDIGRWRCWRRERRRRRRQESRSRERGRLLVIGTCRVACDSQTPAAATCPLTPVQAWVPTDARTSPCDVWTPAARTVLTHPSIAVSRSVRHAQEFLANKGKLLTVQFCSDICDDRYIPLV